jgi:hypothetical protein
MNSDQHLIPPSTLVVEYKSMSLIIRGLLSVVAIIALIILTDALSNVLAIAVLSIWFVLAILWIKKACLNTALIITDTKVIINDKYKVEWPQIGDFYINTIVAEDGKFERLFINTEKGNFNFNLDDFWTGGSNSITEFKEMTGMPAANKESV